MILEWGGLNYRGFLERRAGWQSSVAKGWL